MKGKLIVLEGTSGTGKDTQAVLLQEFLISKGVTASVVSHPSPELKPIIIDWRKTRQLDETGATYLILADRYSRVKQIIEPALDRGEWVISVRNYVSALAYQGKGAEDRAWIAGEFARFEPVADCLIYFDITPEDAMKRITDRLASEGKPLEEYETLELLAAKRKNYDDVLRDIPHTTIDAGRTVADVQKEIQKIVTPLL